MTVNLTDGENYELPFYMTYSLCAETLHISTITLFRGLADVPMSADSDGGKSCF